MFGRVLARSTGGGAGAARLRGSIPGEREAPESGLVVLVLESDPSKCIEDVVVGTMWFGCALEVEDEDGEGGLVMAEALCWELATAESGEEGCREREREREREQNRMIARTKVKLEVDLKVPLEKQTSLFPLLESATGVTPSYSDWRR